MLIKFGLTWIFHAHDAIICKALRSAAVAFYCKLLITQQMGESGSAQKSENISAKEKKEQVEKCNPELLPLIFFTI
jgi:hypothetical protein